MVVAILALIGIAAVMIFMPQDHSLDSLKDDSSSKVQSGQQYVNQQFVPVTSTQRASVIQEVSQGNYIVNCSATADNINYPFCGHYPFVLYINAQNTDWDMKFDIPNNCWTPIGNYPSQIKVINEYEHKEIKQC